MIVSFRKWWVRAKFVAVFVILTVLLYELLHMIGGWIEPAQRYKEPSGKAVKVFRQEEAGLVQDTMLNKLLFFYRYGE